MGSGGPRGVASPTPCPRAGTWRASSVPRLGHPTGSSCPPAVPAPAAPTRSLGVGSGQPCPARCPRPDGAAAFSGSPCRLGTPGAGTAHRRVELPFQRLGYSSPGAGRPGPPLHRGRGNAWKTPAPLLHLRATLLERPGQSLSLLSVLSSAAHATNSLRTETVASLRNTWARGRSRGLVG